MTMNTSMPTGMIPGSSIIHRIHPVTKILWVVVYVILAFTTQNIFILYGMVIFAVVLALLGGVFRPLLKALYLIVPVGSSLIALQVLGPAAD